MADSVLFRCAGEEELFLSEYWRARPLHVRGDNPGAWADVLGIDRVDDILTSRALTYPAFEMVKDGKSLAPGEFTVTRAQRHNFSGGDAKFLNLPRALDLFDKGASIVLWK